MLKARWSPGFACRTAVANAAFRSWQVPVNASVSEAVAATLEENAAADDSCRVQNDSDVMMSGADRDSGAANDSFWMVPLGAHRPSHPHTVGITLVVWHSVHAAACHAPPQVPANSRASRVAPSSVLEQPFAADSARAVSSRFLTRAATDLKITRWSAAKSLAATVPMRSALCWLILFAFLQVSAASEQLLFCAVRNGLIEHRTHSPDLIRRLVEQYTRYSAYRLYDRSSGCELVFSKASLVDGRRVMEMKSDSAGGDVTKRVYSVVTRADGRDLLRSASVEEVRRELPSVSMDFGVDSQRCCASLGGGVRAELRGLGQRYRWTVPPNDDCDR